MHSEVSSAGDDQRHSLQTRVNALETDFHRRQITYARRENQLKQQVEMLTEEVELLRAATGNEDATAAKMDMVRRMHKAILNNVGQVHGNTSKMLQDQEKDLLRAFRSRLFDIQTELQKERQAADTGDSNKWELKCKSLEGEMNWAKNLAKQLETQNKHLAKHNKTLKVQFQQQEEDRALLIRQLVVVKKDNGLLRTECQNLQQRCERLCLRASSTKHSSRRRQPSVKQNSNSKMEERLKDVVMQQKKQIELGQRRLRQLRSSYTAEIEAKSEVELLLRRCAEDVRLEVAQRRLVPSEEVALGDLGHADRERALELLLSQARVIDLLYQKAFPQPCTTKATRGLVPEQDSPRGLESGSPVSWPLPALGPLATRGDNMMLGEAIPLGSTQSTYTPTSFDQFDELLDPHGSKQQIHATSVRHPSYTALPSV